MPLPVRIILGFALVLAAAPPLRADTGVQPPPSVRTEDDRLRRLIAFGVETSPSLRLLNEQLDASDVIVHVTLEQLAIGVDGRLTFAGVAGGYRYVQVHLDRQLSPIRRLSTLGHELQHALEIAQMPNVVDAESMSEAFDRIGARRKGGPSNLTYETTAAADAGARVWRELADAMVAAAY
jgi:hypothetical protein